MLRPAVPEEIGVISPSQAQVRWIRSLLDAADLKKVSVGSIEQFQNQVSEQLATLEIKGAQGSSGAYNNNFIAADE
jgi:hypothetical protein